MYLLVDHIVDMQLGMLELVRELMDLLMQLQFCGSWLLEEEEAWSVCNLSNSATL